MSGFLLHFPGHHGACTVVATPPHFVAKTVDAVGSCTVACLQVLMFVNVSGDSDNVSESFYSLTFASRCRATALGEAKKHVSALRRPSPTAGAATARPKYDHERLPDFVAI